MTDRRTHNSLTRQRTSDDLEACAQALVRVHETDGYPVEGVADPIAWLTPPGLLAAWVAELDGAVVGNVCVTRPDIGDAAAHIWAKLDGESLSRIGVLGRLFVLPEARGHALGERLVTSAFAFGLREQLRLVLDVMEKDQAAIRLYERLGWRPIGTTEHHTEHGNVPARCYVSPPPPNPVDPITW